jgi:hypothetical protein
LPDFLLVPSDCEYAAETSALLHRISGFNRAGVIYDPIADCVSHCGFFDFQITAGGIELKAEDRRHLAISCLDDFEKILSSPWQNEPASGERDPPVR